MYLNVIVAWFHLLSSVLTSTTSLSLFEAGPADNIFPSSTPH